MIIRFPALHKLLGVLSVLVLVSGSVLTGCSVFQPKEPAPVQISGVALEQGQGAQAVSSPEHSFPYQFREQTDNYDGLVSQETKDLYDEIGRRAYEISPTQHVDGYYSLGEITMPGIMGEEQIRMAITAFKNDHPEVFWIANVYSKAYSGNSTIIRLYSCASVEECQQMIDEIGQELRDILQRLPDGLSELDREIFLFQELAGRCVYDTAAANSSDSSHWEAYTICGTLLRGKAVCEGYARTMQILLSYADMECRLINGQAGGTVHMWNLVRVDGEWYHLDPTWNDDNVVVRYDYFNLSDDVIQNDHTPGVDITTVPAKEAADYINTGTASYNLPMPACTSDDANYLKHKGVLINGFTRASDQRVVEALVRAAREGEPAVYLYISPDLNFSMAVNQIFHSSPYKLSDYVKQANRKLNDDHQIRYDRLTYILGEYSRGITLKLS